MLFESKKLITRDHTGRKNPARRCPGQESARTSPRGPGSTRALHLLQLVMTQAAVGCRLAHPRHEALSQRWHVSASQLTV